MIVKTDIPYFLSAEQAEFARVLDRMMLERWPLESRRSAEWSAEALWHDLLGLGVVSLPFREEDGGLGGGPLDIMIVATALGSHLVTLPFVESVAAVATLINGKVPAVVTDIVTSGRRYAIVADYRSEELSLASARRDGNRYVLFGERLPINGDCASEIFLVPARHVDDNRVSLFTVAGDASGIAIFSDIGVDGGAIGSISLTKAAASCVDGESDALESVHAARDMLRLGNAAYTIGMAKALLDRTVKYVKVRKQFGVTIGSFQAIQHRLVHMFTAVEVGSAQVQSAFAQFNQASPASRAQLAVATKMHVDEVALAVAREAVQMHGGMGLTAELDIGDFFRRILILRYSDGGPRRHLDYLLRA